MEFRLLGAAVLAVAVLGAALTVDHGRGASTRRLFDVALGAILAGLVVGRVAAMIAGGTNPLARPGDLLIVRGGVDTIAASVGAVVAVAAVARRRAPATLAALAPAALAALAAWHAGCMLRAACLGTPSGLPWAVTGPGGTVARHPVELYAAALLALGAPLVAVARRRGLHPGLVAGIGGALAAAARLVTEPLRPVIGSSRAAFYAAALAGGLAVIIAALIATRSRATSNER
jgi:prolipoprotein diacylglyceryltransferase